MNEPGYKRRKLITKIFKIFKNTRLTQNKLKQIYSNWFGDIKIKKMIWKDIYANYVTFIQIIFDILIYLSLQAPFSVNSAPNPEAFFYISLIMNTMWLAIFSISIIYRLRCRKLLNNFDIRAYKILYFYHIYWYIIASVFFGGVIVGEIILFFIWSLPNLIYFRKIKNTFIKTER